MDVVDVLFKGSQEMEFLNINEFNSMILSVKNKVYLATVEAFKLFLFMDANMFVNRIMTNHL